LLAGDLRLFVNGPFLEGLADITGGLEMGSIRWGVGVYGGQNAPSPPPGLAALASQLMSWAGSAGQASWARGATTDIDNAR
jgi:hypothetical protein